MTSLHNLPGPRPGKAVVGLLCLLLGGCGSLVTVDEHADEAAELVASVPDWIELDAAAGEHSSLRSLLADAQLDRLVDTALKQNPGLQQTLLNLRIQQQTLRQARAQQLPSADVGINASRSDDSDSSYSSSVSISWELDLWQKLADGTRAETLTLQQQQALYQAGRDSLAAAVMQSWLSMIASQENLRILASQRDTLERYEGFIAQRYRSGLARLEELDSANSATARVRASLQAATETLAQQRRALQTLLGVTRLELPEIPDQYPEVGIAMAELPQQTLARRPDLKAAYVAISAAEYQARAAYKELLPSLDLSAALDSIGSTGSAAFLGDPVWTLLAQLTAPLFRGGELRAQAEIAELNAEQRYQAYRETLLTAVNEVEDALNLEHSLHLQQAHVEAALASAQRSLVQYRDSYRQGLVDVLDLLNVQQNTYELEQQLNELIRSRLANRIDLGLALGLGADS